MQFFRTEDVPPQQGEHVFDYSRGRALLGAALLAGTASGAIFYAWFEGGWLGYYLGGLLLLVLLIFHKLVTARFRSSNWLLRATDEGVFVKFRSYLNAHFDDRDLTVVFFPYSEIVGAALVRTVREHPDRDGGHDRGMRSARRAVEIEVSVDCIALSKLLANERERMFGKSVVGAGKISTRYQHVPVRLTSLRRLQIDWGVVPKPEFLFNVFARHSIPRKADNVQTDFTCLEKLPKAEQEARLIELVEGGDKLGAVALARRLYALDLLQAKEFVEELAARNPASESSLADQS